MDKLAEVGTKVVALSVDDEQATSELVEKHGPTIPVGYGADAGTIAAVTGAFVDPEGGFLQSRTSLSIRLAESS
jgi:peroxiredoxin